MSEIECIINIQNVYLESKPSGGYLNDGVNASETKPLGFIMMIPVFNFALAMLDTIM